MNQEKFVNSYIELLTATVTESIQKNLVLQTQNKVAEQELKEVLENLNSSDKKYKEEIKSKQNDIDSLRHQLEEMRKQKDVSVAESVELKKNIDHIGTFKDELVKSRKENETLLGTIRSLEEKIKEKNQNIENITATVNDLHEKLKEKTILIEMLSTNEQTKLSKPEIEVKKINKKHLVKEIKEIEDAGNF